MTGPTDLVAMEWSTYTYRKWAR